LRILRINGDWDTYWDHLRRKAAAANDNTPKKSEKPAA
jgi:hypothetical protein